MAAVQRLDAWHTRQPPQVVFIAGQEQDLGQLRQRRKFVPRAPEDLDFPQRRQPNQLVVGAVEQSNVRQEGQERPSPSVAHAIDHVEENIDVRPVSIELLAEFLLWSSVADEIRKFVRDMPRLQGPYDGQWVETGRSRSREFLLIIRSPETNILAGLSERLIRRTEVDNIIEIELHAQKSTHVYWQPFHLCSIKNCAGSFLVSSSLSSRRYLDVRSLRWRSVDVRDLRWRSVDVRGL